MTRHAPIAPPALPRFDRIGPETVEADVGAAIAANRAAIEAITASEARGFDTILGAREAADMELAHSWSPIGHLARVADTPALRTAHAKAEEALSEHQLWADQNRALYEAVRAVDEAECEARGAARLRSLALRDFELAGVALEGAARQRYREIALELTRLSTAFSNAVLDATDAFHLDVRGKAMLAGLPESALARFRANAEAAGVRGYRIGLQGPDVQAVLTYAQSRNLRARIYRANATRASEVGPHAGRFDNSARIETILALRHEAAALLGFANSAERSLATKMATSPEAAERFLLDLAGPAKIAAEAEMAVLETAAQALGLDGLQAWDIAFVSERVRQDRFAFDAEEVRRYFPASRVVAGTMALIARLFGIGFSRRDDVTLWHEDAEYYDVVAPGGTVIAGVYLDLFARSGKQGGAWMDVCRQRFAAAGEVHLPVAYLTCNFAKAKEGSTTTLRHEDVVTFLHEFGHVLHHILTEVDYPSIGGIGGVEWDAVELPSQLMENFAWDFGALAMLSEGAEGSPLPRDLFDKMIAARTFQAGLRLCRQLEFALFDLRLHRDYDPAKGARALETLRAVRREVAVVHPPRWHRFPHAFTHIFAGGYAAGYYSYLWAELLSADAFARFGEAGGISPDIGAAFRREVLARGGSRSAAENFSAFRGRDPDPKALLVSYGLAV